jgi:hypothetical protein
MRASSCIHLSTCQQAIESGVQFLAEAHLSDSNSKDKEVAFRQFAHVT